MAPQDFDNSLCAQIPDSNQLVSAPVAKSFPSGETHRSDVQVARGGGVVVFVFVGGLVNQFGDQLSGGDIEHLGGFVATGGDKLAVSGKSHTANN